MLFRSKRLAASSGQPAESSGESSIDSGDGSNEIVTRDLTIASPDLSAIWNELMSMKDLVENEHDRKLRRIESDLRWTMMLVGAQFMTIIGSAIATLVGG